MFAQWLVSEKEKNLDLYLFWTRLFPICYNRTAEESAEIFWLACFACFLLSFAATIHVCLLLAWVELDTPSHLFLGWSSAIRQVYPVLRFLFPARLFKWRCKVARRAYHSTVRLRYRPLHAVYYRWNPHANRHHYPIRQPDTQGLASHSWALPAASPIGQLLH